MASITNTILIIGGTSGRGAGFARRFHALGKKVIVTGRRQERLDSLASELPGLSTYAWDITDLDSLSSKASTILNEHPTTDTILLMAGKMESPSFLDPTTSTSTTITSEITTNLTSPILLTRTLLPALAAQAAAGKTVNLIFVTSGLAYIPIGFYPVYCPTKAGLHAFCVALRQQLAHAPAPIPANLSVCELAPQYVDTDLDAGFRERVNAMMGEHAPVPMPLEEYLDKAMGALEERGGDGKLKKEVVLPGFAEMGVSAWRGGVGKILEGMGMDC